MLEAPAEAEVSLEKMTSVFPSQYPPYSVLPVVDEIRLEGGPLGVVSVLDHPRTSQIAKAGRPWQGRDRVSPALEGVFELIEFPLPVFPLSGTIPSWPPLGVGDLPLSRHALS